ncbi:MAG: hypothetical protein M0Q44_11160 [Methylobacter sp.]|jgi:hypothetical protein|nr:hypothetical protein [Methylobacter sp.]
MYGNINLLLYKINIFHIDRVFLQNNTEALSLPEAASDKGLTAPKTHVYFGTVYAYIWQIIRKTLFLVLSRENKMNHELITVTAEKETRNNGSLLLGTSLALASMILIPAFAMRLGLGASLTGALRIAMMKASSQAIRG